MKLELSMYKLFGFHSLSVYFSYHDHSFQNWTGPGGRTVKTENQDKNRFFKHKEPGICDNSVNP